MLQLRADILVLFLISVGILSAFHIENDVCCGFVIYGLYDVEVGSCYAHFLKGFYQKWVLDFVKGFFRVFWEDDMVFILQFVNVVYHTDGFVDTEETLNPWDKSHLIMMYNPFNVLLDVVC